MLAWIKIATRNLRRNSRRSIFTIAAIGLGFAAVNAFGGFTEYIFIGLEDSHIYAQGNGHLMIFKQGFLTEGKLDPAHYLLNESEVKAIREVLRGFPNVELVSPQLQISGLLSNGEVSTIFRAFGVVPSDVRAIQRHGKSRISKVTLFLGKPLEDNLLYNIGISSGLAQQLKLQLGSPAIALAPTVNGQMNALDVEVVQLIDAATGLTNDVLMVVPLKFAQSLYDTTGVDRLAVLLSSGGNVETVKAALSRAFKNQHLDVDVKTWKELDPFYTKTQQMFNVIFFFLFVIVLVIVVMSVVNTMGMAIVERTREIGTLRALGTKRRGIVTLFALESALLGGFGSILGMVLAFGAWFAVNFVLKPTWIPPTIGKPVPLELYLVPQYIAFSSLFLILLSVGAAILPARKAARQEIVDALGHV